MGCERDRVGHHAGQRALAKIAQQQSRQKTSLGHRCAGEDFAERGSAPHCATLAAERRELPELAVDIRKGQRGEAGGGDCVGGPQCLLADAETSLRNVT